MWVGSSMTVRRAGLSCRGKDASVIILSALEDLLSSCRSKMAGMPPRSFLGVACCKFPRMLRRIFVGGEWGESLLSRPLSVLNWGSELVEVWWVAHLGEGHCLYQLAPTGLLPPTLL